MRHPLQQAYEGELIQAWEPGSWNAVTQPD
uniref:Uncharacterized protein n=1 Tax=Anguilla anguilla TaxID=7936 RepID=A0A0E9TQQ5_ANGAN